MAQVDFWNFDLYQLEGGLEFFRDGRTVRELKKRCKRLICLYTGSDLRTRGIIPAIDGVADLHLTLEFDHLSLYPRLQHVFLPLDVHRFDLTPGKEQIHDDKSPMANHASPFALRSSRHRIVIGHAPTNRLAKNSDTIISTMQSLMNEFPIDLELIEGLPHAQALRQKSRCDIFIDQIGELGYSINALEALTIGICTCTALVSGFAEKYPDHPFVEAHAENLRERLAWLCRHPEERQKLGQRGRAWVEKMHDARQVAKQIHGLLDSEADS
jgi:glycosyltransferase involved in cell wall biosynthesis